MAGVFGFGVAALRQAGLEQGVEDELPGGDQLAATDGSVAVIVAARRRLRLALGGVGGISRDFGPRREVRRRRSTDGRGGFAREFQATPATATAERRRARKDSKEGSAAGQRWGQCRVLGE
jgi:hypothetical protein